MIEKIEKILLNKKLNLYVPAQNAANLTTLNAVLGQNAVNVFEFTKQFNLLSKNFLQDIVLIINIYIYIDKKIKLIIKGPSVSFLVMEQFFFKDDKSVSKLGLLEVYKIAVLLFEINKLQNLYYNFTIKSILKTLLGTLKSMHIEVVNDLKV